MRIDVHAHYWTEDYIGLLLDLGQAGAGAARGIGAGGGAELAARLRLMDRAGVRMQVPSACPQLPYGQDGTKATTAARFVNDQYADLVQRYPDRFRAFAALPMPHLEESLGEMGRALDENGDTFVRAVDYINDPQVDTTAAQAILDQNASALLGIGQERQGTASSPVRTR